MMWRIFYARIPFENVLDRSLQRPGDQRSVVDDAILNGHMLLREDRPFLEFACRVRNYPEREHFERDVMELRAIKILWQQGAGINLSVCGYLTQQSVLLELRYVAYLEVYLKTLLDAFINERIQFNNRLCRIQQPYS
jgi:hypothetical protein